ncbi:MAG: Smr/MutS family protein [Anaerolineales bacterium]|jgi:DNA mismatch repair protein MutS2
MDTKTLHVLEYPKILERLAGFCDFSASAELARALTPTGGYDEACERLAETSEARKLLSGQDLTIGAAHDIRELVDLAAHDGVLEPKDLLDVHHTLIASRDLRRAIEKVADQYPHLGELALRLPAPLGLVEAISHTIADSGEVLDSASPTLASLRGEIRIAHDRLMARLQRYLTDPETASKLQDAVITQRDGRYVIPLRAEFKGQVKSIVHDQSSTGATLFVEPLAVVELNNTYRELQLAERDEVRRILAELSAQVGALSREIVPGIRALAQLDLAFAKAKYADELHAAEPILHKPVSTNRPRGVPERPLQAEAAKTGEPASVIRLFQARHPLLDPASVVPIDIDLNPGTFAVVITGPNTGGKTVTLKTVGLLAIMAQSGLHIPAQSGSELSCFHEIYADIGDEQSIEQSLSTFSGHITNIIHILKKADRRALVILDELGAGTDPQEGAALARALLSHLLEQGVSCLVATHYPELKTFAHNTPGVVNAALEFDLRTLRPTYRLTIGLPGRSNALAIAQRLGLPETIIAAARSEINPQDLRADQLIGDIHRQRNQAHKEREKAERARSEARRLERELAEKMEKIEEERQAVLEKAREEGELEIAVLKTQLKTLKQELKKARQPLEALQEVEEKVEIIAEQVEEPIARRPRRYVRGATARLPERPLAPGEKVILPSLGQEGVISALSPDEAEVQVGALRVRAKLEDLQRKVDEAPLAANAKPKAKNRAAQETPESSPAPALGVHASPGLELDLRGERAEDALVRLDRYLEQAYLAGLPFVRIIHGKGTGKLRQEVRAALKVHPHVAAFEEGRENEGGAGVTVAKIVNGS